MDSASDLRVWKTLTKESRKTLKRSLGNIPGTQEPAELAKGETWDIEVTCTVMTIIYELINAFLEAA